MVQQRDPEATRQSILEAAEQSFVRDGFAAATMSGIARKAGVTKSLIHHHFGSKQELWEAVKARQFGGYAEEQQRLLEAGDGGPELLGASIRAYFRFLQRNPQFSRMMSWMHMEANPGEFAPAELLIQMGSEQIRRGQREGLIRDDVDPTFVVHAFVNMVSHYFHARHYCAPTWRDSPEGAAEAARCCSVPPDETVDDIYLDTVVKIFMEGVLPRQK